MKKAKRKPSKKIRKRSNTKTDSLWWKLFFSALVLALLFVAYTDAVVRNKFEGKKWALPAQVFARPLEIFQGQSLSTAQLRFELQGLGYKAVERVSAPGQFAVRGTQWRIYSRSFNFSGVDEPARSLDIFFAEGQVSSLRDQYGDDVAVLRLDPQKIAGIYPAHREDRLLIQMQDAPLGLVQALIAIEDRKFLSHYGVSLRSIGRAMLANIQAGRTVQGGSTLTQQLVKNFYLGSQQTLWRKGVEAVMAVLLEVHYSKQEILETYLNEIYLGQRGKSGIHGFGLASEHYFAQPLRQLQPYQYALLVALVKGASFYNPYRYPERATERRNLVLNKMAEDGYLNTQQLLHNLQQPLGLAEERAIRRDKGFPAYIGLVRRQLRDDYRDADLRSEGLQIFTNFDPWVQHQAESVLQERLTSLDSRTEDLQAALVSVQRGTGAVQAVVGDRRVRYQGFNRALDAYRPIGSLVKPAIYLSALQRGLPLTSLLRDETIELQQANGDVWRPENYDGISLGNIPMFKALAKSRNLAAVNLGLELGLDDVELTLQRLGLNREVKKVPSMLLGALELSPFEVAQFYHTLAAEGFYNPLTTIRDVAASDGSALRRYPYQVEQRLDVRAVHLLQYAMQMVLREGTAVGAYRWLPREFVAGGKTGTSNDQRDSWFAGFSDDRVTTVWVGRDDNKATALTGSTAAMPIWAQFTQQAGDRSLEFNPVEGVDYYWVDRDLGLLSGDNCKNSVYLPFLKGSEPKKSLPCEFRENPLWHWLKGVVGD